MRTVMEQSCYETAPATFILFLWHPLTLSKPRNKQNQTIEQTIANPVTTSSSACASDNMVTTCADSSSGLALANLWDAILSELSGLRRGCDLES